MRKIFGSVLLLLFSFLLMGCNSYSVKNLKGSELFDQEGKYLIFVHKENCVGCDEAMEVVIQYNNVLKEDRFKDKRKVYGFDVSKGEESLVYRSYSGVDGQGTNGAFYVNNVTKWNDLYIGSTPALLSVDNTGETFIVRYVSQGAEAIIESLTSFLE
ncbi:MAG: hypothetical protein WC278_01205 [Bacilli bacterium]|jgi:hypothetical protein|nr:hypothetical protein [Bacilli bacterium]MDD2681615.1 hypothetical protein [Bacilli bacterium]MDD3120818.1 hypothetical protein [Bacilli bacterium]MDD4063013.1 hypothetical protein [Bacilli bacterium]MDD4481707.1 hypothetical protein [Bacilli bacterium]